MKKTVIIVMVLLVFSTFVLANSDDSAYLGVKSERVACNVNFHLAAMQGVPEKVSENTTMATWVAKLQQDMQQLQAAASSADHKAYQDTLQSLRSDLKSANNALLDVRKNFHAHNVSKENRQSLRDSFKSKKTDFTKCVTDSITKVGQAKYDLYSKALQNAQDQANKLSQRNISITEMNQIISDAETTIMTPLKTAIDTNDSTKITTALKAYCLYNGCSGINFHFAAKMAIEKLSVVLAKVTPQAESANLSSDVTAVQTQIDSARALLASIGTSDFKSGQQQQLWADIKAAEDALKKLRDDYKNVGVK